MVVVTEDVGVVEKFERKCAQKLERAVKIAVRCSHIPPVSFDIKCVEVPSRFNYPLIDIACNRYKASFGNKFKQLRIYYVDSGKHGVAFRNSVVDRLVEHSYNFIAINTDDSARVFLRGRKYAESSKRIRTVVTLYHLVEVEIENRV